MEFSKEQYKQRLELAMKQLADLKATREASKHYQPPLIPLEEILALRRKRK